MVPVIVVADEAEALERANDSHFGLGASVWTKDRAKGERIARRIESGMVWINDHSYSHGACQCSWGGVKDSGLGRSHSKFGFYECVNVKLVAWEPGLTRDFWWQPYDATLGTALRSSARLLYGRDGARLKALREGLVPAGQGRRADAAQGQVSARRSSALRAARRAAAWPAPRPRGRPGPRSAPPASRSPRRSRGARPASPGRSRRRSAPNSAPTISP